MTALGSCLSRLSVVPAILLVAAYVFCALHPVKRHDARPATVASKTYADSGSGRAKMLRPSRMQVRLPNAAGSDPKKWSEHLGDANLANARLSSEAPREPVGSWDPAPNAGSIPLVLRRHHPRDPPQA
jgi:hypothetical protein